jgi:transcriptional regulator
MYVQSLFDEQRTEVLHDFIAKHRLGSIITTRPTGIEIDHLPFTVHPEAGTYGAIRCHCTRSNPIWSAISAEGKVVVVFQGPHAYISPAWMPGRKRHRKVAPSWNYAAVHAYCVARPVEDREWLRQQLRDLALSQERLRSEPWTLEEPPPEFVEQLLDHIVGIEMTVERLVGKWFVGQQRSPSDREGVVAGLMQEGTDAATAVASMMKAYAPPAR